MDLRKQFYYGFQSSKRNDATRFEYDLYLLEKILQDKQILNRRCFY